MGRVVRGVGRAIRGIARGAGRVVKGVFKGTVKVIGGTFRFVGKIAKGILGSPLLMGVGGAFLGFSIMGPLGLLFGGMTGMMLGQSFGMLFAGQPQVPGMMPMGSMAGMGMPNMGMMGGMPGFGMPVGMGMPWMPSMMPMTPGCMGFNPYMQQQMMMQMMMMMMLMQMMMMQGGYGFPPPMFPPTMGPRGFIGVPPGYPSCPYPNLPPPVYTPAPIGPAPYNPVTGNRIADTALAWNGRHFKPGQTKRCADFVSTIIERSGAAPPGFRHEVSAARLARYGVPVNKANLKPGDIVFFGNTYRPGRYTHVGIYIGNGKFIHRPTANKPVRVDRLDRGYYARHYTGARRLGV